MGLFNKLSFLKLLLPFRAKARQNEFQDSLLGKLPFELIDYLATFLDPSTAALHILCHYCQQLHLGDKARHNSQLRMLPHQQPPCTQEDIHQDVQKYIHKNFNYVTFQTTMKLHRSGIDCSRHLSLLAGVETDCRSRHTYQWAASPRIVNDRFLLRFQQWFLFPVGQQVRFPTSMSLLICPHWAHSSHYKFSTTLGSKMACRASHWDNEALVRKCPVCSGLHQCVRCPTEFQIGSKDFGSSGVALVVTRWSDLGEGLTPLDPTWESHLPMTTTYSSNSVLANDGPIKNAYEGGTPDEVALLEPGNKGRLFQFNPLLWKEEDRNESCY